MLKVVAAIGVSVVALVVSSVAAYRVVCSLPVDCLTPGCPLFTGSNRSLLRLLGLLLFVTGVLMALPGVPGQGVITTCVGLLLLDLPWLRGPLRLLLARPALLRGINRLRERAGQPPLAAPAELPSGDGPPSGGAPARTHVQ